MCWAPFVSTALVRILVLQLGLQSMHCGAHGCLSALHCASHEADLRNVCRCCFAAPQLALLLLQGEACACRMALHAHHCIQSPFMLAPFQFVSVPLYMIASARGHVQRSKYACVPDWHVLHANEQTCKYTNMQTGVLQSQWLNSHAEAMQPCSHVWHSAVQHDSM